LESFMSPPVGPRHRDRPVYLFRIRMTAVAAGICETIAKARSE
jgi:hypothetical protein